MSNTSDILATLSYALSQRGHGSKLDADTVDRIEGAEILLRNGSVPLIHDWDAGPFNISCNILTAIGGFKDANVVTAIHLGSAVDIAFTTDKKDIIGAVNSKANLDQVANGGPQIFKGWGRGTRIISGGDITQYSGTAINIAAGSGVIYDSTTQVETPLSWNAITNFSIAANIAAGADASYILIASNGSPTSVTEEPLDGTLRNAVYLGKISHRSGGAITNIRNIKLYGEEALITFNELTNAIGSINVSGNIYSPYAADLRIQKDAGTAYRFSINADIDRKHPSFVTDAAVAPITFNYCQRKAGGGVLYTPGQTVINPGYYDIGNSTLDTVLPNRWTLQRIYWFPRTNSTYIFYGWQTYGSISEAQAGISGENFEPDTTFFDPACLRAYLLVRGAASNLATDADARFIAGGKFSGGAGGGIGGGGAATLQSVYDSSSAQPKITTNSINGSLQFKRGTVADTDAVLEILNGAGDTTTSITGAGVLSAVDVRIPSQKLNSPTYMSMNDFFNSVGSCGRKTGGTMTDAGSSYIAVAAGTGFIKATNDDNAQLMFFDWPAPTNILIPASSTRYIGVEYNLGTPRVVARTSWNWDLDTEFPLGRVINEPINGVASLHIINNPWWVTDGITNIIERFRSFGRIRRDENTGGFIPSVTGTRSIAITAGQLWSNLSEYPIAAIDTNVSGTFEYYWYKAGSGWQESSVTQYSVTQWNDVTLTTLQTIPNNKYCNVWIYAEADDEEFAMLYPQALYNSAAEAEAASQPTLVPAHILNNGLLIGKIVFKQGVDAPVGVYSAFTTQFSSALVTSHPNLGSLGWTISGHTGTASVVAGFNGSGVASEFTTTGSGTVLALATSPVFVTGVTGSASFNVFDATSTTINAFGAATTLAIGYDSTGTSTLNLGLSAVANTFTQTLNLGTGDAASGGTKVINIGTAGLASSTTNINIGSAVASSVGTTTISSLTAVKISRLTTAGPVYTSGADGTLNSEQYLSTARGGTGVGTFTQYGILYGDTTSSIKVTAAGADNYVLCGTGVAPAWETNVTVTSLKTGGLVTGEQIRIADSSATGNPYISWYQTTTRRSFVQHVNTNHTLILDSEYGDIAFYTAATAGSDSDTEYMRIKAGGNVGVGETSPAEKLHINGNIRIDDSAGNDGFKLSYDNTSKVLNFMYAGV